MKPVPMPRPADAPHLRVLSERVLSDNWYTLKTTELELQRRNGQWQHQVRETYDRGNGAVLLLYSQQRGTVVLTRQFRYPAFVNGSADGMLIEACAGLLDGEDAESCIRREAMEETGYAVRSPRKVFEVYMSPGSVTEKLHFFVADYEAADRTHAGGGVATEGEDIEVLEMPLPEALAMVRDGRIQDAKTIMLLQYVALESIPRPSAAST